jgi:hypothetical protein
MNKQLLRLIHKDLSVSSILYLDIGKNLDDTILLAGTGRAGTTWLANIINYDNRMRYIFEPFCPLYVKRLRNLPMRLYLNHSEDYVELQSLYRYILSGSVRNIWTDRFNKKYISHTRLIKDIRINLSLNWIKKTYPGVKIVFLMRHPLAVALSRFKLNWKDEVGELLEQKNLVSDHLSDIYDDIVKCDDAFQRHIYLWCIENYIPLKLFSDGDVYPIFYENICLDPKYEIEKMLKWLGITVTDKVWETTKTASAVTRKNSAINTGESLVDKWKNEVNVMQTDKALEIMSRFGLDQIYDADSMPKVTSPLDLIW